jgi:DNA polymerase III alpha subunit
MEEFGYSFISHPLERYATKIKLLKDLEDGDMITIAGIISDVITRKTKTNRTFYNVLVQAPREKVSITLWDKAFKKNEKILFKGNSIKVTGTKGYGGMSCDTLIEFNK